MPETVLSQEEKTAVTLISELNRTSATLQIETYFDFADKWNIAFPKADKKLYDRGKKAIKTGAKAAGVSTRLVYSILSVTKLYDRKTYAPLAAEALQNGITIRWTHLRDIEGKLRDNEPVREQIEQLLVQKPMTSKQLKAEMNALLPASTSETSSSVKRLEAVVSAFRKSFNLQEECLEIIDELSGGQVQDAAQTRLVIERLTELSHYFDELGAFMEDNAAAVQQLCDTLLTEANEAEDDSGEEEIEDNRDIMLEVSSLRD